MDTITVVSEKLIHSFNYVLSDVRRLRTCHGRWPRNEGLGDLASHVVAIHGMPEAGCQTHPQRMQFDKRLTAGNPLGFSLAQGMYSTHCCGA